MSKTININGSLMLKDGVWYVNGRKVSLSDIGSIFKGGYKNEKVTIVINLDSGSNIEHLDIDACESVTINGNCGSVHTDMGSINIGGNVSGNVHADMGSIQCGNVGGDVISHMGNVSYRR